MKSGFWLLLFFLFSKLSFAGSYVYDYNDRCRAAYQNYLSLNISEGDNLIRQELISNPYNLMATYLADYGDCLLLLLNGDRRDYEQRDSHLEQRIKLLYSGNEKSPWHRLCKAGIYFHWALVHIRFAENFKAATTFRKSFLLLKENNRLFPDFPQNKIFLGLEEAIVGTIPENYQWIASIFGMKGNVKKGVAMLGSFIKNADGNTPLLSEAIIYNCYLRFYLMSEQEEVWSFVNSDEFPVQNNLFHAFVKANLALNFRKGDIAVQTLKNAEALENYKNFPVLDYEMGSVLMQRLDDDAIIYLERFLSRYKGSFFVKDACQKLSLAYYLTNSMEKAQFYRKQILVRGSKSVDADKQAQRFAEGSSYPAIPIVQLRMLSDGGYFQKALQKIENVDPSKLNVTDKLEYYFRVARIYDALDNESKAIEFYQTTRDLGRTRKEHFAARAALQMGFIYEHAGKHEAAIKCYKDCLSMKDHDFQANIDQQAKAGINRLTQR